MPEARKGWQNPFAKDTTAKKEAPPIIFSSDEIARVDAMIANALPEITQKEVSHKNRHKKR